MVSYVLYSVSFFLFLGVALLYFLREHWVPQVQTIRYALIPGTPGNFQSDVEAGLHSSNFDLSGNIEGSDGRHGLDERGKREVQRIMKSRKVDFDEARRIVMMNKFAKDGISADGTPTDPKFVSFGR